MDDTTDGIRRRKKSKNEQDWKQRGQLGCCWNNPDEG